MNQTGDKKIPASPEEWLQHALSDLKFAKLGYESSDILFQQICFHAQQAVEKALKAVLLFSNNDFPLTHDIVQLLEIFNVAGISLPQNFNDAAVLTPYAVEIRYPGLKIEINEQEVEKAVLIAEKITSWAKIYIGLNKK